MIKLIHKDTIEGGMLQLGQKKLKLEQDMTAAEEGKDLGGDTVELAHIHTHRHFNVFNCEKEVLKPKLSVHGTSLFHVMHQ